MGLCASVLDADTNAHTHLAAYHDNLAPNRIANVLYHSFCDPNGAPVPVLVRGLTVPYNVRWKGASLCWRLVNLCLDDVRSVQNKAVWKEFKKLAQAGFVRHSRKSFETFQEGLCQLLALKDSSL